MVGMVVPIGALLSLCAHGEEACRLPEIDASLHEPRRCGVPQGVRRDALEGRPAYGGRQSPLVRCKPLAVDRAAHNPSSAHSGRRRFRRRCGNRREGMRTDLPRFLLVGSPTGDLEVDPTGIKINLRPAK